MLATRIQVTDPAIMAATVSRLNVWWREISLGLV